jgi:hypothetical protein
MPHRDVTKVSVPFTRGLAQSVDPKLAPQGAFVTATNWTYDKDGRLRVRPAYSSLTSLWIGWDNDGTARAFSRKGSLVRLGEMGEIEVHADSSDPTPAAAYPAQRGDYQPARLEGTQVVLTTGSTDNLVPGDVIGAQVAHVNGYTAVAWIQGSGGGGSNGEVWACIYEDTSRLDGFSTRTGAERTHTLVYGPTKISGTDTCANVRLIGSDDGSDIIYAVYYVAADTAIKYAAATVDDGQSAVAGFAASGTVVSDAGSTGAFDIALHGVAGSVKYVCAYHMNDGANKLKAIYIDTPGAAASATYTVTDALQNTGNVCVATETGATDTEIFVIYDNGTNIVARMLAGSAMTLDADFPVNVDTTPVGSGNDGRAVACTYDFDGAKRCCIVWQTHSNRTVNQYGTIKVATLDEDGTLSSAKTFYGALIASRPFVSRTLSYNTGTASAHVCIALTYDNDMEANGGYSYMMLGKLTKVNKPIGGSSLSDTILPVACLFRGGVGGGTSNQQWWVGHQPMEFASTSVSGYSSDRYSSVFLVNAARQNTIFAWGSVEEERVTLCDWDLEPVGISAWSDIPATHADMVALSGGLPRVWDGQYMVHPFLCPPVVKTADATAQSSGGSMETGDYQYIWVWEYTDENGRRWQSEPSIAISVNHASGSSNSVDFNVPPLRHTFLTGNRKPYAVAYRTAQGPGSIFYRCSPGGGWPENDHSSATALTWTDTIADATLTANEVLYYSRAIVNHEWFPASQHIVSHAGRLFGISSEDRNRIWFTAELEDQEAPIYSSAFQLRVEGYGPLVALASMDGKLYAFTETAIILAAYGDGPDKTGGGGIYPSPSVMSTEAGCSDPRSVVLGPGGIYFAGYGDGGTQVFCWKHGDAGLERVGDGIRDQLSTTPLITSAVHAQEQSELRFTANSLDMSTSAILVYSYSTTADDGAEGVWFIHSGDGSGYHSATTWRGRYYYGTSSADYIEDTGTQTSQTATLETGDLWPAGLHGHTRVKATTVMGENGPAVQNVDLAVAKSIDHGQTYGESKTFTVSGNDADGQPMTKRRQWRTQRTTDGSVRFKLTASSDGGGAYDVILNGITIEHLPESGGPRLGSSDRG